MGIVCDKRQVGFCPRGKELRRLGVGLYSTSMSRANDEPAVGLEYANDKPRQHKTITAHGGR